jgi:hypothetical protein
MLGGQWKVKEKSFSPLFTFPQPNLLKLSIFPFDFKILLYHVLGHYSRVSFFP